MSEIVTITWRPEKAKAFSIGAGNECDEFKSHLFCRLGNTRNGLLPWSSKKLNEESRGSFWQVRAKFPDNAKGKALFGKIADYGIYVYGEKDHECMALISSSEIPEHLKELTIQDNQDIIDKLQVINRDISSFTPVLTALKDNLPKPSPERPSLLGEKLSKVSSTIKDQATPKLELDLGGEVSTVEYGKTTEPSPVKQPAEQASDNNVASKQEDRPSSSKDKGNLFKFNRAEFSKLEAIVELSPFFVRKKITCIFGDAGIGKTGLYLSKAAEQTRLGRKVLIIANDMSIEEFRPFLYGYGAVDNLIAIFPETEVVTEQDLLDAIEEFKPDIIVVDTFDVWLEQCAYSFLDDGIEFSDKSAQHWGKARKWVTNIIAESNIALLAILHVPAKSNPFKLPHSAKLKGLLYRTWLLVAKENDDLKNWSQESIVCALKREPDHTICLFPDKQRGSDKDGKLAKFFSFSIDLEDLTESTVDQNGNKVSRELDPDDAFIPCEVSEFRTVSDGILDGDGDDTKKKSYKKMAITVEWFTEWFKKHAGEDKTMPCSTVNRTFGDNTSFHTTIGLMQERGTLCKEGYGVRDERDGTFKKYRYALIEEQPST